MLFGTGNRAGLKELTSTFGQVSLGDVEGFYAEYIGSYRGYIGIMEKKMETTIV